jgi:hypothetical protein
MGGTGRGRLTRETREMREIVEVTIQATSKGGQLGIEGNCVHGRSIPHDIGLDFQF